MDRSERKGSHNDQHYFFFLLLGFVSKKYVNKFSS